MENDEIEEIIQMIYEILEKEGYVNGGLVYREYYKRKKKHINLYEIQSILRVLRFFGMLEGKKFGKITLYYKKGDNYEKIMGILKS